MSKISYLRARDPSIISYGPFPRKALFHNSELHDIEESIEKIVVYLRLKKTEEVCTFYDVSENKIHCRNQNKRDTYKFSYIFNSTTTQADIFNYIAKPKIVEYMEAKNFTLLTYGCSGSGKTFTLIGTDAEPGIIPRSLNYLFKSLKHVAEFPKWKPLSTGAVKALSYEESMLEKKKQANILQNTSIIDDKTVYTDMFGRMEQNLSREPIAIIDNSDKVTTEVWISFLEIYNEHVYDLLANDIPVNQQRKILKVNYIHNKAYVKNLTSVHVSSSTEAFELLQYGLNYLNYASTAMNKHSSRSHCMFIVKLVQTQIGAEPILSHFTFCDLAGSERMKNTKNVGLRLKESNNINTSLFTLQKCIKMLRDSQKSRSNENVIIPYRESKLTQLLQPSLIGEDNISMIVNFNPSTTMFAQSQIVLKFSAITRQISFQENVTSHESASSRNGRSNLNDLLDELEAKRQLAAEVQKKLEIERQDCRNAAAQMCAEKLQALRAKWESELLMQKQEIEALEKNVERLKNEIPKKISYRDKLKQIIAEYKKKQ